MSRVSSNSIPAIQQQPDRAAACRRPVKARGSMASHHPAAAAVAALPSLPAGCSGSSGSVHAISLGAALSSHSGSSSPWVPPLFFDTCLRGVKTRLSGPPHSPGGGGRHVVLQAGKEQEAGQVGFLGHRARAWAHTHTHTHGPTHPPGPQRAHAHSVTCTPKGAHARTHTHTPGPQRAPPRPPGPGTCHSRSTCATAPRPGRCPPAPAGCSRSGRARTPGHTHLRKGFRGVRV